MCTQPWQKRHFPLIIGIRSCKGWQFDAPESLRYPEIFWEWSFFVLNPPTHWGMLGFVAVPKFTMLTCFLFSMRSYRSYRGSLTTNLLQICFLRAWKSLQWTSFQITLYMPPKQHPVINPPQHVLLVYPHVTLYPAHEYAMSTVLLESPYGMGDASCGHPTGVGLGMCTLDVHFGACLWIIVESMGDLVCTMF